MLRILITYLSKDQSLCGPGIFEMVKDRGPLCGPVISGPEWSESGPVPVFFQSQDQTFKH